MNVEVTKHKVIISKDSEPTHENEYKITECNFTYDDYIDSFHVKRAIFTILSTGEKYETDIINNKCYIPHEVLTHEFETVKLGVYAFNIDEEGETPVLGNRVSPSHALFVVNAGSYLEGAVSPEIITPSQYDLYSDALQEGLDRVDEKLDEIVETVDEKLEEVDDKLEVVDEKLDDMSTAIEECDEATERTNNLNLDVSDKIDGDVTVTLTKKDLTTKTVVLSDGTSLMFNWDGTKLGIKTDKDSEYVYVDLQGQQGPIGPQGNPFQIKKTYATIQAMIDDYDNMEINDYVMISGNIEQEDNAKLFTKTEVEDPTYRWQYLADFSGATGIQGPPGPTPNIQIGSVTSGSSPSVTRTGTDENPILNFVLQKGDTGEQGEQGETGNGIASIEKTGTSGLIDTYTITYTDGTTSTFTVTNGEDGEVSQEQLDRVAMVYNLIPTVNDTNENITLNKTGEAPLKLDLKGNTYQEISEGEQGIEVEDTSIHIENVDNTKEDYIIFKGNTYQYSTTGKNLLDDTQTESGSWGSDGAPTTNNRNRRGLPYIPVLPNTTYTMSSNMELSSLRINEYDSEKNHITRKSTPSRTTSFTITTGASTYFLRWSINYDNSTAFTEEMLLRLQLQLEQGTQRTSYEKYTGGIFSPSPEYPKDIEVVSGNNTVKIIGKNLFDKNNALYSSNLVFDENYIKFQTTSSSTRMYYMECEPNTIYSISKSVGTILRCGNCNEIPANNVVVSSSYSAGSSNQLTFTTNNDKYIYIYLLTTSETSTITYESVIETLQVEKSTTVTTYEAYQEQSYPINLPVKNLFDKNNVNVINGYPVDGGFIASSNNAKSIYIAIQPNKTYTVSKVVTSRFALATTTNIPITQEIYNQFISHNSYENITIKTSDNDNYLLVYLYNSNYDTTKTLQDVLDTLQIEEGSHVNSYTPFGVEPIELCKVGTHFDYFYKSNNKWYLRKETAKGVFDGTENWEVSQSYTGSFYIDGNNGVIQPTYAYSQLFCNNFTRANINSSTQLNNFELHTCYMALASGGMEFWYDNGTASLQDFKDYLSLHNMYVYYILSTPVITEITDTTLKSQLDALYTAQLNSGINNINTKTNNLLPYINLKYNTISVKPTPEHPSEILTVTGENNITISNSDNTKSASYPINLGSMELCKLGNYQDYIYKDNEKWYKHKEIDKVVLNGGENWALLSSGTYKAFNLDNTFDYLSENINICFCDNYKSKANVSSNSYASNTNYTCCFRYTGGNRFYITNDDFSTVSDFKNWLSTNNSIVYYILATSTNTEITNTDLINQLEYLYNNAISYNNQTNITQTNYKEPFIITATAFMNIKNIIDDLETRIEQLENQ